MSKVATFGKLKFSYEEIFTDIITRQELRCDIFSKCIILKTPFEETIKLNEPIEQITIVYDYDTDKNEFDIKVVFEKEDGRVHKFNRR